jgi:hypothetical protein
LYHEADHLIEANRHIAAGTQRVSDQEKRLAKLKREGSDTVRAETLLAALRVALGQMIDDRHQILVTLGKQRSTARRGNA